MDSTYAYRSYLETLLSYGTNTKQSQLTCEMYYKDTVGHMEVTDIASAAATNTGFVAR